MPSRFAVVPRRQPSQARGRQRVEKLLAAAEAEIAKRGYAGATMSAIAERAQAAIGSLYQFYPNKEALAEALRTRYAAVLAPAWEALMGDSGRRPVAEIAGGLVRLMQGNRRRCPAFAALVDAPPTSGSPERRSLTRRRIAAVLRARRPQLPRARALRYAAVVRQLMRGSLSLPPSHAADFEELLTAYLTPRLAGRGRKGTNA